MLNLKLLNLLLLLPLVLQTCMTLVNKGGSAPMGKALLNYKFAS